MPPQEPLPTSQLTNPLQQIVDRFKGASNVLVTVSTDPSVDQLAACIGLTIALNKHGKNATAVFSGAIPPIISFLEPDKTIEKNTDSLQDFIIALDKSKADKLRYKVEDSSVKIFITPYKTNLSAEDLDFSQGDFNVDAVIALGVHERTDLDSAIIAHGRILHDATVISVNNSPGAGTELGAINWLNNGSSSLCEMTSDLISLLDKNLLDSQISTALLTGIVAETDRFRNEKSTPHTMSIAGLLMAAGASPQLVAEKLENPPEPAEEEAEVDEEDGEPQNQSGVVEIEHSDDEQPPEESLEESPEEVEKEEPVEEHKKEFVLQPIKEPSDEPQDDIRIDSLGKIRQMDDIIREEKERQEALDKASSSDQSSSSEGSSMPSMALEPPQLGGQLTANSVPESQQYTGTTDPLSSTSTIGPTLNHQDVEDSDDKTLADIEKSVDSPHLQDPGEFTPPISEDVPPQPSPDYARDAVERAANAASDYTSGPIEALGATQADLDLDSQDNNNQESPSGPPPPPVPPPVTGV